MSRFLDSLAFWVPHLAATSLLATLALGSTAHAGSEAPQPAEAPAPAPEPVGDTPTCDATTTNEDVAVPLEAALGAYEDLDIATFEASAAQAETAVACLGESISRGNAAEFHRVRALAAFLEAQETVCMKRFAAARSIEPQYRFPTTVVPDGNPVLSLYDAVDPKKGASVTLPFPKEGTVRLDGSTGLKWNRELPIVYQRIDANGLIIETRILAPNAPVPDYPSTTRSPEVQKKRRGARTALTIAGVGSLVAAGGLYGIALGTKGAFNSEAENSPPDEARLNSLYRTNHGLVITSAGLATVGVGLTATSFALTGSF